MATMMMSGTCVVIGRITKKNTGVVNGLGLCHTRLPSAPRHGSVSVAKYEQSSEICSGNDGLNHLARMPSAKGLALGLVAAALATSSPDAQALQWEFAEIAAAANNNDNRGLLLLFVLVPAVLWVLFNILRPALNQLDRMKSS